MGFSNLIGLSGLIFIPVIIVLYMLRPKHKPKKIPSLYLWQSVSEEIESASRLHRLRNSLLMVLQILAVLLLVLVLAGLFIKDEQVTSEVIVIVDGSVTMQSMDVEPNRHEYAKALAIDYVNKLDSGTIISLVELKEVPHIIVSKTKDKDLIHNGIEGLDISNSYWNPEVVTQTLNALRTDEATVVYFGDQSIDNAKSYLVLKNRANVGVYDLVLTKYPETGTVATLSDVYNHGEDAVTVPISMYVDERFYGAKEITIEADSSQKVFFEGMPLSSKELRISLDEEDILPVDNEARTVIAKEVSQKVLLVSGGSLFLEKVLKLEPNIELYQVAPDVSMVYEGYDLYIFDGFMPEMIPTDGSLLFFAPDAMTVESGTMVEREIKSLKDHVAVLGSVKHPDITTAGHRITTGIEKPEFLAASTQVYELPDGGEVIYGTSYGPCAFSSQLGQQKMIVYGFDIHNTDLPLNIEFPILMSATFRDLLTTGITDQSSVASGDGIEIYLKPNYEKASVWTPSGIEYPLDMTKASQLFLGTDEIGMYEVEAVGGDVKEVAYFAVNPKQPSGESVRTSGGGEKKIAQDQAKSLKLWLGIAALLMIVAEWLIYSIRRKNYGYSR